MALRSLFILLAVCLGSAGDAGAGGSVIIRSGGPYIVGGYGAAVRHNFDRGIYEPRSHLRYPHPGLRGDYRASGTIVLRKSRVIRLHGIDDRAALRYRYGERGVGFDTRHGDYRYRFSYGIRPDRDDSYRFSPHHRPSGLFHERRGMGSRYLRH